jgi:hypothetical protein
MALCCANFLKICRLTILAIFIRHFVKHRNNEVFNGVISDVSIANNWKSSGGSAFLKLFSPEPLCNLLKVLGPVNGLFVCCSAIVMRCARHAEVLKQL